MCSYSKHKGVGGVPDLGTLRIVWYHRVIDPSAPVPTISNSPYNT